MDNADSEALDQLAEAIGQPPRSVSENAKALFPFIEHEAQMNDDRPAEVAEDTPSGSPDCRPAAPGR